MTLENTISKSQQGNVNSLLNAATSSAKRSVQGDGVATETATQAANDGQGLPSLFASLLSMGGQDVSKADTVSGADVSGDSLLSSFTDATGINALASDGAISVMQDNLLNALRSSLFQSSDTESHTQQSDSNVSVSDTKLSTNTTDDSIERDEEPSIFSKLYDSTFGSDGLNLKDGFDALNIVNHLPIVSDFYETTSETHVSSASNMAGSFIYGGIGGLIYSAVDMSVEGMTGASISQNLWSIGKSLASTIFGGESSEVINSNTALDETSVSGVTDMSENVTNKAANAAYDFVKRSF